MKKIVYFKKIEEITPKSEYTSLITNIFGRRLDVYSEEGSIYVLTDPKLAYLTQNINEIMELEMNNIIFKHISCKEVQIDKEIKKERKIELENFEESVKHQKSSIIEDKIENSNKKIEEIIEVEDTEEIIKHQKTSAIKDKIKKEDVKETLTSDTLPIIEDKKEKLDLKITEDAKAIKLAKRREREKKEELLENLEYKKPEKSFGIKETFAVIFTILFALVNVYLWMLINARNK